MPLYDVRCLHDSWQGHRDKSQSDPKCLPLPVYAITLAVSPRATPPFLLHAEQIHIMDDGSDSE